MHQSIIILLFSSLSPIRSPLFHVYLQSNTIIGPQLVSLVIRMIVSLVICQIGGLKLHEEDIIATRWCLHFRRMFFQLNGASPLFEATPLILLIIQPLILIIIHKLARAEAT